ncbi:hypothetical protein HE1_01183 [Holospora elegans E1]|uniref:Uncharacterized protein n=1 Tax=Holospora elegans E1 TaxID=1427503 RepID=A0A023DZ72_9PROT|nr:hypothetical protein HE1_01183 [Holospora elegans E1]
MEYIRKIQKSSSGFLISKSCKPMAVWSVILFNEKRFIFSLKEAGAWNNFIKTCLTT